MAHYRKKRNILYYNNYYIQYNNYFTCNDISVIHKMLGERPILQEYGFGNEAL
jgi:hypothetical protein